MIFFYTGVTINCLAIIAAIVNAVYDAIKLKSSDHNVFANLAGFVLFFVVLIALSLHHNGKTTAANIILWIPAIPLLLTGVFLLIMVAAGPDWK